MKALVYRSYGEPEVLEWVEDWAKPATAAHQVLVRVIAGSVNPKDVLLRKGKFSRTLARTPLPRVSGMDIAGEVVDTGRDIVDLSVGDLIFGMTNTFAGGVHSEYAVFDAGEVAKAPANISPAVAASVPLAAQTALQGLRDLCKLGPDQRVLINGASGGVGHFAVQIAKILGAEVHAVCGSNHLDFVRSLGADAVHNYTVEPPASIRSTFNAVFDVYGSFTRKDFAEQLGRSGVFVSTVPKPATLGGEFLATIRLDKRRRLVQVKSCRFDLDLIRKWIERKQLNPHVEKIYPITDACDAHRHIEGRHTTGKVVLSIEDAGDPPRAKLVDVPFGYANRR